MLSALRHRAAELGAAAELHAAETYAEVVRGGGRGPAQRKRAEMPP